MDSIDFNDKYLNPPDEPEAQFCKSCGEEMPILDNFGGQRYSECVNLFCPNKHEGIAREMAELIVELRDEVNTLRHKVTILQRPHGKLL